MNKQEKEIDQVLDLLNDAEMSKIGFYFQLVDGLKSIRFLIDDVRNYANLSSKEREKLNCAFLLSELIEKRLNMSEFDLIAQLRCIKERNVIKQETELQAVNN